MANNRNNYGSNLRKYDYHLTDEARIRLDQVLQAAVDGRDKTSHLNVVSQAGNLRW